SIGASNHPNHRVGNDRPKHLAKLTPHAWSALVFDYSRKTGLFRGFLDGQCHADCHCRAKNRGRPEEPAPMQGRDAHEPQETETGKQCRTKLKNTEASQVDDKAKDAGKSSAFAMAEPGGIDFHKTRGAKSLQITVHTAYGHKEPEHPEERSHPKQNVHEDRAGCADEHGAFSSYPIRQQTVDDLSARVRKERGCDNGSDLRSGKPELLAKGLVGDGKIVATHVKACV